MRKIYDEQLFFSPAPSRHPRAAELKQMSLILDAVAAQVLPKVHQDLTQGRKRSDVGRQAMTAEQVLRAALIKQLFCVSYEALAFHLEDSIQLRAFCRLSPSLPSPKKSALQANVSRLDSQTLQAVNETLVLFAQQNKLEDGRWMRTDATVIPTNIHCPLDSTLLWDCVRVLTRILCKANKKFGSARCNQKRRAKRRSIGILNAGTMNRRIPLYKDLLKVTRSTCDVARAAAIQLDAIGDITAFATAEQLRHFLGLAEKVVAQTERRVLRGESVPASEKIVSIFEPHTDIIKKDRRNTHYGHKVTLSTGRSGLVLDVVVEKGNPADSTLALRAVDHHAQLFGKAPERVAFDGGFASIHNLHEIKKAGSLEVSFSKPSGVPLDEMTTTARIRKNLKRFRAGIEAGISFLKRSFGWDRVTWSGLPHFQGYVWCSTLAHNLLVVARTLIARYANT